jgi:hypothetical protein
VCHQEAIDGKQYMNYKYKVPFLCFTKTLLSQDKDLLFKNGAKIIFHVNSQTEWMYGLDDGNPIPDERKRTIYIDGIKAGLMIRENANPIDMRHVGELTKLFTYNAIVNMRYSHPTKIKSIYNIDISRIFNSEIYDNFIMGVFERIRDKNTLRLINIYDYSCTMIRNEVKNLSVPIQDDEGNQCYRTVAGKIIQNEKYPDDKFSFKVFFSTKNKNDIKCVIVTSQTLSLAAN